MGKKLILIIGGGFAGVHAAAGAADTLRSAGAHDVAVELVSPDPHLVIRPRLYESDLAGVRIPLPELLDPIGVSYRAARVTGIDTDTRTVTLDHGKAVLHYDQLVFTAGSHLQLPSGPSVYAADTYPQATALNEALANLNQDRRSAPRVVVVGAGFTGLELAAELSGSLRRGDAEPGGAGARAAVTLVERAPLIAPEFGPRARAVISSALTSIGVECRAGAGVSEVAEGGVILADGSRIQAELVFWTAGPRASELTSQIPGNRDALGRLEVDEYLAAAEGVWAAGDSAAARATTSQVAAMSCQQAIPQGRRAGENAAAALTGARSRRYRQPLYLTCLDLGPFGAIITTGFERDRVVAAGPEAKPFKRYINRSLIYPPQGASARQLLKLGLPEPSGRLIAAITRAALRSATVRRRVCAAGEDRALQRAQ